MRPGPPPMPMNEQTKKFTLREQWAMIRSFASYYPRHKKLLVLDFSIVILTLRHYP